MGREPWIRTAGLLVVLMAGTQVARGQTASGEVSRQAGKPVSRISAGQTPVAADVVFNSQTVPGGGSLLTAEGPMVRCEKTAYPDRVVVMLASAGDRVTIRADGSGVITVARGNRSRSLSAGLISRQDLLQIRNLLAGSDAVSAFRAMAGALESDETTVHAESIVISGAMVGLLDGDFGAPLRAAQRILRRHAVRERPVVLQRTSGQCWDIYEREAYQIATDADNCSKIQWWNPVHQAACGAEFVVRSELNWLWLISCSGGLLGQEGHP
jgi:hypothetical protein